MYNVINVIFKREKIYYKRNWRILTTLILTLTVLLTLLIFLPLNDINNFNNSIPYHIQVENASIQDLNEIKNIKDINEFGVRNNLFMAKNKSISFEYYDSSAMKFNSIVLKEGRLPREYNEVVSTSGKNRVGENVNIEWINQNGDLVSQDFKIVGIAKNNLLSDKNATIFIVSTLFASRNSDSHDKVEAYLLLNNANQEQIDTVQTNIENLGIEEKDIHVNTYYVNGILGNRTQLLLMMIFGLGVIFLSKSIISAVYTVFIEGDKPYFYKMKILGLDIVQFNKLMKKRFLYLTKIILLTLLLLFVSTLVFFKILEVPYSMALFLGVGIYVFIALELALKLMFKKQVDTVKEESSNLQKYGYDFAGLKNKQKIGYVDAKSLAKRNQMVYKKRYKAVLRNMSIVMILFIMISTSFNSINLEERLKQVFHYNESFIIYPELNNQYDQIDDFQAKTPFDDNFENRLQDINGVEKIICNKAIFAEIKDNDGGKYEEIFEILNEEKQHILSPTLVEGDLNGSGIILNGSKLLRAGISGDIGDSLVLTDKQGNHIKAPIIAAVNDRNSKEEIYITEDIVSKLDSTKNYTYSISVLKDKNHEEGMIKDGLEIMLKHYPNLKLRDYDMQLSELKDTFRSVYFSLGGILVILLLISIASFVNIERVNLIQRKKEFALLQINGMDKDDILKSVLYEGVCYIKRVVLIVPILSLILSYIFVFMLNKFANLSFLKYKYSLTGMLGVILLLSIIIIVTSYYEISKQNRENVIDRVRI